MSALCVTLALAHAPLFTVDLFADKAFLPQDRCGTITLDMGIFVPVLRRVTLSFTGRNIPLPRKLGKCTGRDACRPH